MTLADFRNNTKGEFKADTPISTLILLSSVAPSALTTEMIQIEQICQERSNIEITRGAVSLKSLAAAVTFGEDASVPDADGNFIITIELSRDGGALHLWPNEYIRVTLTSLISTRTYSFYGFEQPLKSEAPVYFENKPFQNSDTTCKLDTSRADFIVVDDSSAISEYRFNWENGVSTMHLPIELRAVNRSLDPLKELTATGVVVTSTSGKLVLQTVGIDSVEIRKADNAPLNVLLCDTLEVSINE